MTHLVEARNDPVNGAGLLFVRHRFFNILVTVESVYEHVLQNPIMLAACLGDLSDKLLTLDTESKEVQNAWTACCDFAEGNASFASNIEVLEGVRLVALRRFHNLRMYEYTVRLSEVLAILGEDRNKQVALRKELKAGSSRAGSGTGEGAGSGTGGLSADAARVQSRSIVAGRARWPGRSRENRKFRAGEGDGVGRVQRLTC